MNPDIARVWDCREAVPRLPMCQWADCHRPATTTADSWDFCDEHHAMHGPLRIGAENDPDPIDEQITDLHAQGYSDGMIGILVGLHGTTVGHRRQALGLPAVGRPGRALTDCGTATAYGRHLRRHEPIDETCRRWFRRTKGYDPQPGRAPHAVETGERRQAS